MKSTKDKPHTKATITKISVTKEFEEAYNNLKATSQNDLILKVFNLGVLTKVYWAVLVRLVVELLNKA